MLSEDEQEEIIETFLDTIEARDMIREMKYRCKKCNCQFDNVNVAFKKSVLSENVIEQIKGFNRIDTRHHKCDELKMSISKLEKEERHIKTLDVFFLLYDIPKGWQIGRYFGYDRHLYNKLDFLIDKIRRGKGDTVYRSCDGKKDEDIKVNTINKIFRYTYGIPEKYKKYDFDYPFSKCPVFKLPKLGKKSKINNDYLNSADDFE